MTEQTPDIPADQALQGDQAFKGDQAFQRLCHEAVLACGDDMAAVELYVLRRLDDLPSAHRAAIVEGLRRVLAFRAPERGLGLH